MAWLSGVLSIASGVTSAMGNKRAGEHLSAAGDQYSSTMKKAINKFITSWTGTAPEGYASESDYLYGSTGILNLKKELTGKEIKAFKKLETVEDQNKFLSDKLGYDVSLKEYWDPKAKDEYGMKTKLKDVEVTVQKGATETPGTCAAVQEIEERGGAPSKEAVYRPWIAPGEQAYEKLTKAIVNGDFSDFYTSPGYEFRKSEGEKSILRQGNAGKIPTTSANKALIDYGQNLASNEYQNYLTNLSSIANQGYGAQTDLDSEEAFYKGTALSAKSGKALTELGIGAGESSYIQQGYQGAANAMSQSANNYSGMTSFSGGK